VIAGDVKPVGVFFLDATGNHLPLPSVPTAALLDSTGATVGSVAVTDSKTSVGYLLLTLTVPSSGNRPATLRISFPSAWKHDIAVRAWS
jgi:hypothetical protein